MSDIEIIKPEDIKNRIYTIRGVQVMLDKDLAVFYEVKPIRLREQVKRNKNRFPSDFMFQLSEEEVDFMVSQNAIPSRQSLGGSLPYVFTEQGVAAISSVLTSERAVEVSIQIMRTFVSMRRFLIQNAQVLTNVHDKFIIIDSAAVYHFGASLKDLGKKWFAFSKMDMGALKVLDKIRGLV